MIRQEYPDGYEDNLISFQTPTGELATALPLETEDISYLIKMPKDSVPAEEEEEEGGGSSNSETQSFESLDNLQIADEIAEEEE